MEIIATVSLSVDIDITSKHYFHNPDTELSARVTGHCPSGSWRQVQPCPMLPAERGEQLLELSDLELLGCAPWLAQVPCGKGGRWLRGGA